MSKTTTKVTFKKEPKETGLAAVGRPYQASYCKIKGKGFGTLDPPSIRGAHVWTVRVMIMKPEPDGNPNCDWKWLTFKRTHNSDEQARVWLQENIDRIQEIHTLRFAED